MERSFEDILSRAKRRVAWLRHTKRHPLVGQSKLIAKHKPTVSYSSDDGDTLAHMIDSLRTGDIVIVAGLHRLGSSVSELRDALARIRDAKAQVADVEAGVLFDPDSVLLLAHAERVINGERRGAGMELAMRRREHTGGRKRDDGSMNESEAKRIWQNKAVATNADVAAITGWSVESLFRHFGPSGRAMGRPRKKS